MNTLRVLLLSIIFVGLSVSLKSQNFTLTKTTIGNSGFVLETNNTSNVIMGTFGQSIVGLVNPTGNDLYLGFWSPVDLYALSVEDNNFANERKIQNYPNPVSNYTEIKFELEGAANATLKIYDVNGKLINELFKGYLGSGEHSVSWNALRNDGQLASNGTYLYELNVEPLAGSAMFSKNYTLRNVMVVSK
jgi:hypothetical protein